MAKLTKAQITALKMFEKRDWPAGQPRLNWTHRPTQKVLLRLGLIVERPNTADPRRFHSGNIVDLTDAGRAALAQQGD